MHTRVVISSKKALFPESTQWEIKPVPGFIVISQIYDFRFEPKQGNEVNLNCCQHRGYRGN